ncbi:YitT family protein [Lacibacter luteus]|uniref:YitT family protein n=1 Tax=Lacibacter luteus TaxID=2508719 RepID=A0A4Q1CNW6_9BACT|nr:YitT family protein [Lacibacter luteus]RXK62796.1 YitT family protein [Lacibacter luteus]
MQSLLKKIIINTIVRRRIKNDKAVTNYQLAMGWRELKITFFSQLKDVALIITGIFSAAFGFKGFLLTNHFIDGGATGISLLISALTKVPLYILLPLVNIPFILLALKVVNRTFAIKTALAICGLALVVATVEFPNITNDNLLVALFGGFFLGAGIGLSVRGGAVIDGTEVLAIYLSRKLGTTMGDIIILINICIFGTAAYFLSIEIAMYSLITYLAASKTLDFIVEGLEEYIGVTIISSHNEEIRQMLINNIGRGFTVYNGKRGFGKKGESQDVDIIYTVVTRLELNKLKTEIEKIDPHSFVVMSSVRDTKGGMIKKRPLKH